MKTSVTKIFSFEAAHFLPHYEGKCKHLHGHHWVLEVEISGPVGKESGMVVDFGLLKKLVNEVVIDRLDHTNLNEALEGELESIRGVINPTCENLLDWIWTRIGATWVNRSLTNELTLESLKLWETPDSFAELRA